MDYFFRCINNPKAPVMRVTERWEAEDMAKHPDFERVDAKGRKLQNAAEAFDNVQPTASVDSLL
jgi:hypothetical protein